MLIKTLRHRYNSIGNLLYYMVNGMEDKEKDLMIAHNLPSFDVETMKHEFLKNDLYRQQTRAEVRWYHEFLSFSPLDSIHLNTEKLEKIARQYIAMRNPRAMCYVVSHTSEAHTHLHFCFSGSEYRSRNILRMDDKTFKNLREGMERWQIEQFPELENSIVYIDREQVLERAKSRDKNSRKQKEYLTKKRLNKRPTEKELLSKTLRDLYNKSETLEQFYRLIKAENLSLSERNGKINGVVNKRKYRFKTLGITNEMLVSLDRYSARQRTIQRLTNMYNDMELDR